MSDTLSNTHAAQKLLALLDTLGILHNTKPGSSVKGPNKGSRAVKTVAAPDASSVSWAFHESVDKTGFLRWLIDNVSAKENGLTDSELELFEYLQQTGYNKQQTQQVLPEQIGSDHLNVMPAFELQKQRQKIEVRVGELEKHAQIIGPQNEILTDRVELLAREIAELKAQEESLVRAAAASDSEVA
ncbi:hypothetical protein H4R99_008082, partial [Coemansia sp. RSA 1722]